MAKLSREGEIEKDLGVLGDAIDAVMGVVRKKAPGEAHESFVEALSGLQLKAIDRLVPLLERKARLLGLDQAGKDGAQPKESGTLAELERKLALVKS